MTEPAPSPPVLLVSDFNLTSLHAMLARAGSDDGFSFEMGGFGEVVGPLLSEPSGTDPQRAAIVWPSPTGTLAGFTEVLSGTAEGSDAVMDGVDRFADLLAGASERFRFLLVVSWTPPPGHRGLGMLDLDPERGMAGTLLKANLRLAERLRGLRNVFLLDGERWARGRQDSEEAARLWYLSKTPLTHATLELACQELLAAIKGVLGMSKKVVVVDLDNTLWGGIVGDVGWESLRLGGHDPVGEAFSDFQRSLKDLTNRGVVLGIVSKNEEGVALEAIRRHPEMVLTLEDFAGWRINWQDKALNLVDLVSELNVGLDSVVFIDDNASERGRVSEALPKVTVPEWPSDPMRYAPRLRSLPFFDVASLSQEDRIRAQAYVAERKRREVRSEVGSLDDWLESLGLEVEILALNRGDLPRATQLLNKTNQMNLSTRRLTEAEFWEWSGAPGRSIHTVRVRDRFGDYGLTGLVSLEILVPNPADVRVATFVDFVLSCRVFGRQIERTMVHHAAELARREGAEVLEAELIPTLKNEPCRRFFEDESGFTQAQDAPRRFRLTLDNAYPLPGPVTFRTPGPVTR